MFDVHHIIEQMTPKEELEKEIILRKNALKFCKQEDLKELLKDNLIKCQDELLKLIRKDRKKKD